MALCFGVNHSGFLQDVSDRLTSAFKAERLQFLLSRKVETWRIGNLERITYGVVPDGNKQVKPEVGSAPPLTARHKSTAHGSPMTIMSILGYS
jgi:hypothetical protein